MKGVAAIIAGFMLPAAAYAHGFGASLERTVGEYWIDIGYDPSQVIAGDRMVFDFNLAEAAATSTPAAYDYVWVRLRGDDQTLFATAVRRADIGPTTLLYTLPRDMKGDLTLSVRYQKENATLAESDFTLPMAALKDSKLLFWMIGSGLVAAAIGAGAVFIFLRRGVHVGS